MRTLEVLQRLDKESKAEVFLVGGFVRDFLRKKINDDLDVVIRRYSLRNIVGFLSQYGSVKKVTISPTNDTIRTTILLFKAFHDATEAQISLPRRGKKQIANVNNTLTQDATHRDFTINAMYMSVNDLSIKGVIDHSDGRSDISNRVIKANGDPLEKFETSPVRIMRAISLAARTGYSLDTDLVKAIKKSLHLIEKVPMEAIQKELNTIIMSKKPSKYMRLMKKLGILDLILPELSNCYGVTQEKKYHKYDVFTHCIYSCDRSEKDLILRLAALFHDIGKQGTRKIMSGRITFHKHEIVSAKLATNLMKRLRYSGDTMKEVVGLIRLHMYHYTREYTDSAVRRFITKAKMTTEDIENIEDFPLFKLRSAERLGNGFKDIPVTEKQKDFQARIKKVYAESTALTIENLDVDGKDVMGMFNVGPGKIVGEILNYLLSLVIEKPTINNKRELLSRAAKYLCDRDK